MTSDGVDWKDHYKHGGDQKRVKYFETSPVAAVAKAGDDSFKANVEAVVGLVDSPKLEKLRAATGSKVEQAVNMYLDDNTAEQVEQEDEEEDEIEASSPISVAADNAASDDDNDIIVEEQAPGSIGLFTNWQRRFIGSFQATMYATRSGNEKLKFGENLTVIREPAPDPSKLMSNTRGVSNLDNTVVRCCTVKDGVEKPICRLTKQDAQFAAVLIDAKLGSFSATFFDIESCPRLGQSYSIKVDCFLNREAFYDDTIGKLAPSLGGEGGGAKSSHKDGYKAETEDDKILRLRQNGLAQLFNKLNLDTEGEGEVQGTDFASAAEVMGTQLPPEQEEKELDQDQLDSLYKRNEPPDTHLKESTPADTFKLELRPYQKKGLTWMMQKESDNNAPADQSANSRIMHPLWRAIKWPSQLSHLDQVGQSGEPDECDEFYVNLYSGELSKDFPQQKKSMRGGILADEMGLGKTISTMALVHSSQYDPLLSTDDNSDVFAKHTTLVVAPMSLLSQWESEVYASSHDGSMRALIYYGSAAGADLKSLLCHKPRDQVPNVVITSYGTLLSEHGTLLDHLKGRSGQGEDLRKFGLYGVKFFRVVLDEAHTIRNRSAKTSKAACAVRADRLWALTGTPIVNKLDDLFSIVKFLGVEPWNNLSFWKAFVSAPFENKGFVQAMHVVQSIMEPLVLRRTKAMKQPDGTLLVQLPPKTVTIQRIKFSHDEQALYNHIFARVRSNFLQNMDEGNLGRSYASMLAQILRLRQICCHPGLISNSCQKNNDPDELEGITVGDDDRNLFGDVDLQKMLAKFDEAPNEVQDASVFGAGVVKSLIDQSENVNCPFCLDPIPPDQQAVTDCWHMACLDCLQGCMEYDRSKKLKPRCVTCRAPIQTVYHVRRHVSHGGLMLRKITDRGHSSKVSQLLTHLHQIYANSKSEVVRTVVFSQFTSYLTLIQTELDREGFKCLRFDGTMSQKKRAEVLEQFRNAQESTVFCISLKAGGVGLNLVQANRAYLMDPWWAYSIEEQAIDRLHRMGQQSEVNVTRFIIEGSIEERMLKIQDRKKFLATTLGMNEEEKRAQRLEDIKMMFE